MDAEIQQGEMRAVGVTERLPWLSLLIPAYDYPEGVARILNVLASAQDPGIECLIGDDSTDSKVERLVSHRQGEFARPIQYVRQSPRLGAVANWNRLLGNASGRHILFMHHDECPEDHLFFAKLRAELSALSADSHVILNCKLPAANRRWRAHMPFCVRSFIALRIPQYLLRRNVIGSPSVWVAPRIAAPVFDIRMRWLVDVDWYTRMLAASNPQDLNFSQLAILSFPRGSGSITASLRDQTGSLAAQEAHLVARLSGQTLITQMIVAESWKARVLAGAEQVTWLFLRVSVLLWTHLRSTDGPDRVGS